MKSRLGPVDPDAPDEMRALAERLRGAMTRAGYTVLRTFASDAELSPSTVSEALGGAKVPSWSTVTTLLKTSDASPDSRWRKLWERAAAAEQQRHEAAPALAAKQHEARRPGLFSIRPPIGNLPSRVRGRDEVLDHLTGLLNEPKPAPQVLYGLGGCGKTTIALEAARRAQENGNRVFWVSASDGGELSESMKEIVRELGVPEAHVDHAWGGRSSAMDLLWRHLDAAGEPWLLVVDNADDPGVLAGANGLPGDGTGWVRPSTAGTTVITTRVSAPQVWGSQAELHPVGVLGAEAAADVLVDLAGHAGGRSEARALAQRLGGLPLALRSAGTYLGRTARGGGLLRRSAGRPARISTFDDYRLALDDAGTTLLDQGMPPFSETERVELLHRGLVGRTWEMSLDLLEAQGYTYVRALMRLMSCFAPAPVPVDLIDERVLGGAGSPALIEEVDRALEALVDLNMLTVTRSGALASVPDGIPEPPLTCVVGHRLVLDAVADRLRELSVAEQARTWHAVARLITRAAEPEPEEAPNWDWWRLLLPHLASVVPAVPAECEDAFVEVLRCAVRGYAYMPFSSTFDDVERYAQLILTRAVTLDEDHPIRLAARHRAVLSGDRAPENEGEYRDILARQTAVLGARHPETLITHHQLASTLGDTRGAARGAAEMKQVAEARAAVLGRTNPYTLVSKQEWIDFLIKSGDHETAEAELRATVADCRSERGDDDHNTLVWTALLARALVERGDLDEASEEFQGLRGGPITPAGARFEIAKVLQLLGRHADAEDEYRQLLVHLREVGLDRTQRYRSSLWALSNCLREQGRAEEAVRLHAEVVGAVEPRPGFDEHRWRLRMQHAQMRCWVDQAEDGENDLRELRAEAEASSDADPILLLDVGGRIADVLNDQGKLVEEERELRGLVERAGEITGEAHRRTHVALLEHARSLRGLARDAEALTVLRRRLAAQETTCPPDDQNLVNTRLHLTRIRLHLGEITAEEALAELAAFPSHRDDRVNSFRYRQLMREVADARARAGEEDRAVGVWRDVERQYREMGDSGRQDLSHACWELGLLLESLDRYPEALAAYEEGLAIQSDLREHRSAVLTRRRITRMRLRTEAISRSEAIQEFTELVPTFAVHYGSGSNLVYWLRYEIAELRRTQGEVDTAREEFSELAAACRTARDPADTITRSVLWKLAICWLDGDDYAGALPVLEECLAAELAALEPGDRSPLVTRWRIAQCRKELGLCPVADTIAEYEAVLSGLIEHDGEDGKLPVEIRLAIADLALVDPEG